MTNIQNSWDYILYLTKKGHVLFGEVDICGVFGELFDHDQSCLVDGQVWLNVLTGVLECDSG